MMSPRMAKPIPAAIRVKKLAQKSNMLLNDVPAEGRTGGAPAAMLVSVGFGCRGWPAEIDSECSEPMTVNSLPRSVDHCGDIMNPAGGPPANSPRNLAGDTPVDLGTVVPNQPDA